MDEDLVRRVEALEREVERLKSWQPVPPGQQAAAPQPAAPAPPSDPPLQASEKPAWRLGSIAGNQTDLESRIGGKWLAIAGITLLVIAIVFFFQLAVERGWIGLAGQVILGVLLGLLLWAGGAVMAAKETLTGFAQVISAGGVAIAAFAVFVGHHFEAYQAATGLGLLADSVLLGLLGLGAAADAGLRRVPVQAGTATGLIVWTAIAGLDATTFSLAYTTFMVAALLAVGVWRNWPWMASTAAPASVIVFIAHLAGGTPHTYVFGAVVLVHALIMGAGLRAKDIDAGTLIGHAVAWTSFWVLGGWSLVQWADESIISWWSLNVAALAFTAAMLSKAKGLRLVAIVAGTVAALAAPIFLEAEWARIPLWLGLFAAAEVLRRARQWTTALSVRPVILFLIMVQAAEDAFPHIEAREGRWVIHLVAVTLAVAAGLIAWQGERKATGNRLLPPLLNLALGLWIALITLDVLFTGPGPSVAWAVIAVGLVVAGFTFDEAQLRVSGLVVFAITLVRVVAVDLAGVDAVWRVLAFMGIAALLLLASWLYVRNAAKAAK